MPHKSTLKNHFIENQLFLNRIFVASFVVALGVLVLLYHLGALQIIHHEKYATLSRNNHVALIPIPPIRGLIYDRNGVLLAQNIPTFSLEITPEETPNLKQTLKELQALFDLSDEEIHRVTLKIKKQPKFARTPIKVKLKEEDVAKFAVNKLRFPGVEVEASMMRDYPLKEVYAH